MNILLVDDEVLAIDAICAKAPFAKYGITEIYTANSMKQAKEFLQTHSVDMMLCDIEMPGGSGLELMEWANGKCPDMVKMILSSHNEFDFAQQAMDLSCLMYLLKPATPELMDKALAKAVALVLRQDSDRKLKHLGEVYAGKLIGTENQDRDLGVAETVEKYIMEHIQEDLVVEQLAQIAFVSQNHLGRCFKKKYGKTVLEYISDYRLSLAEKLLRDTDMTVTMISAKIGYPNYGYFTKQFKKYSGYTPSQYRAVYLQKQ